MIRYNKWYNKRVNERRSFLVILANYFSPLSKALDFFVRTVPILGEYSKVLLGDGVRENILRKESICEVRILTAKVYSLSELWRW